jgi:regulator of protease activity HflC (stomatin/prohibitin superfamily)
MTEQIVNFAIWGVLFITLIVQLVRSIKLVPTKFAYVVERLGLYNRTLGPGFHALLPFLEKVTYIQTLKEETIDVPPQECFTNDNVRVEVDGVMYISINDPVKASYGVVDYRYAAMQLAQTTIRSIIGTLELDKTFEERDMISGRVVNVLTEAGELWGIKVHRYEIKNIVPPKTVQDAMEKQVSAERQKRAIISQSEGVMQSRINKSEGHKTSLINQSEGEKQKRINEAEGKANEILALASATAESIELVGNAIHQEHGEHALLLQLSQKYLERLGGLAKPETNVLLPVDLTKLDKLLDSLGLNLPK